MNFKTIDIFPFRQIGCLLEHESEWFESRSESQIDALLPLLTLAEKIRTHREDSGIKTTDEEAIKIVQTLGLPEHQVYALKFSQDIKEIQTKSYSESKQRKDLVEYFLNSRVSKKLFSNPEFTSLLEETYGIELNDHPIVDGNGEDIPAYTFTPSDIKKLPLTVTQKIVEFIESERNQTTETTEVVNESLGE